jgi:hypothetical protein
MNRRAFERRAAESLENETLRYPAPRSAAALQILDRGKRLPALVSLNSGLNSLVDEVARGNPSYYLWCNCSYL